MIVFPNCKINLGLNIVEKRNDGYHNLETVFLPINFTDALEVLTNNDNELSVDFSSSGLNINGNQNDNLCLKAYYLLKQTFKLPNIKMHLHKNIPMGAGLGGGSSDAAFTLLLLNELYSLNISEDNLLKYSLNLGSDCPFFIINKVCFATGRGEVLEPIDIHLNEFKILLINPNIHISTAQAFAKIIPKKPIKPIQNIIKQPIETWQNELVNDFEQSAFSLHPSLKSIKDNLYSAGAVYVSMTGTGSTFFGLFSKQKQVDVTQFNQYHFCKWVNC